MRAPALVPARRVASSTLLSQFRAATAWQPVQLRSNIRFYGGSRVLDTPAAEVLYKQVKDLSSHPSSDVVIVDVREPNEYDAGHIPNAVNIPFKTMPGALGLDPADFESTLGFPKPDLDKTLLFYCQGGVRSTGSEQLASTFGYNNRINYKGSYDDWLKHESDHAESADQPAPKL